MGQFGRITVLCGFTQRQCPHGLPQESRQAQRSRHKKAHGKNRKKEAHRPDYFWPRSRRTKRRSRRSRSLARVAKRIVEWITSAKREETRYAKVENRRPMDRAGKPQIGAITASHSPSS